jgi:hypothetical protein
MDSEVDENDGIWCSFGVDDERWIRQRFEWLVNSLGLERLWQAPFLTLCERDFPDPYAGTEADAAALFSRVCAYLNVDVNRLKLGFFSADNPVECELAAIPTEACGLYEMDQEKATVWLDRAMLHDTQTLIATMGHELCHDILLGGGLLDSEEDLDHEHVTELTTVFLGFGIFSANDYLQERSWHESSLEYSSTRLKGYFSLGQWAYSLALAAWYRNEFAPVWLKDLRSDLRDLVPKHLRRLAKSDGIPLQIPRTLDSKKVDAIRRRLRESLGLPELIVTSAYETATSTSMVPCICPCCRERSEFSIEFAGHVVVCPFCRECMDVPDLPGGKQVRLDLQRSERGLLQQNWAVHRLGVRWRNCFLLIAIVAGVPMMIAANEIHYGPLLLAYYVGIGVGAYLSKMWIELKSLECSSSNSQPER